YVDALILEMPAAIEHALVLRLGGDDVILLTRLLEEPRDALDAHVVALSGATRENDLLRVRPVEVRHVLASSLDGLLAIPAVGVGPRVRVAILANVEGQHGVQYPRINRSRRLHIEIDGAKTLF